MEHSRYRYEDAQDAHLAKLMQTDNTGAAKKEGTDMAFK